MWKKLILNSLFIYKYIRVMKELRIKEDIRTQHLSFFTYGKERAAKGVHSFLYSGQKGCAIKNGRKNYYGCRSRRKRQRSKLWG